MSANEAGQGSIELVSGAAALVVVSGVILQVIVLGSAWLDAQSATRVADRAEEVGADGRRAGRAALASGIRSGAAIHPTPAGHRVTVRAQVMEHELRLVAESR